MAGKTKNSSGKSRSKANSSVENKLTASGGKNTNTVTELQKIHGLKVKEPPPVARAHRLDS